LLNEEKNRPDLPDLDYSVLFGQGNNFSTGIRQGQAHDATSEGKK